MASDPQRDTLLREWLAQLADAPLDSRDDRYVPLDAGKDGLELRGTRKDPKRELFNVIDLGESATCQLFTGFRGTGKSTELRRLKSRLEAAGYVVLIADVRQYHSLARNLLIDELLFVIAGAFGAAASEQLGKDVTTPSGWERLSAWLGSEVQLGLDVTFGPVQLEGALKGGEAFLTRLSRALEGHVSALAAEVHAYVGEVVALLQRRLKPERGVVFILDNLEHISAPIHEFHERMDSVKTVFSEHAGRLRLPGCHCVYSVPLYLQDIYPELRSYYDGEEVCVLPMVKVFESDEARTTYRPGLAGLRRVLADRVPLDRVFGDEAQLERVIAASAGHLRSLLALVRHALVLSREHPLPLADEAVDDAIRRFHERLRATIRADAVPLLDSVRASRTLARVSGDDMPLLARYIDGNLVLCYQNGGEWYDLHPAVGAYVARLAAELREEAAEGSRAHDA